MSEPAAVAAPAATDLSKIVETYIALRDKKASMKAAYEASVSDIDRALGRAEAFLLTKMQEQGVESYKTSFGTAYRQVRTSVAVADWDSLLPFIQQNSLWNMLERRANKTAVEEYRAAHDDLPPGLNYRAEAVVNVRRS